MIDIPFNLDEAKRSNILINGTNATGKTRLACGLASILQCFNWKTIAFDVSGVWKNISDISYYVEIDEAYFTNPKPITLDQSIIVDISRLRLDQQKFVVEICVRALWLDALNHPTDWTMLIMEESEIYERSLRTRLAQELYRIQHVGRNQRLRTMNITTRLANLDTGIIELCGQRYFAKIGKEQNTLRKMRSIMGKDWTRIMTELDLGYFVYECNGKTKIINIPCFTTTRKPQPYIVPKTPTLWQRAKQALT